MNAFFYKSVGRIKCRLCLAHAHRRLHHIDTWFSYGIYKRLLRGIWVETKDIAEGKVALEVRAPKPTLRQSRSGAVTAFLRCKRCLTWREEGFVRRDPVRDAGDARKKINRDIFGWGPFPAHAKFFFQCVDKRDAFILPRTIACKVETFRRKPVMCRNSSNKRVVRFQSEEFFQCFRAN